MSKLKDLDLTLMDEDEGVTLEKTEPANICFLPEKWLDYPRITLLYFLNWFIHSGWKAKAIYWAYIYIFISLLSHFKSALLLN